MRLYSGRIMVLEGNIDFHGNIELRDREGGVWRGTRGRNGRLVLWPPTGDVWKGMMRKDGALWVRSRGGHMHGR